jgi:hypothetical protein
MTTEEGDRFRRSRLASFELFASDDLSATVEIQPCHACDVWYLEAQPLSGGRVVVREWHHEECTHLESLLSDDVADAD